MTQEQSKAQGDWLHETYSRAKTLHQNGDINGACRLYDEILARFPQYPAALHYRGLADVQRNQPTGLEKMRLASVLEPNNHVFTENFSKAEELLKKSGQPKSQQRKLEVTILSYNRVKTLALQIQILDKLGYMSSPFVSIIVQDNNSTDGTFAFLSQKRVKNIKIRRWNDNVGYQNNYLKAHELCEAEYLWVLGDDFPQIPVDKLLVRIDEMPTNCIYSVFQPFPNELPLLPLSRFSDKLHLDLTPSEAISGDSNIITLFGGFVSNVIWRSAYSKKVYNQYKLHLHNDLFTSGSPQFLLLPLLVGRIQPGNLSSVFIRAHRDPLFTRNPFKPTASMERNVVKPARKIPRTKRLKELFALFIRSFLNLKKSHKQSLALGNALLGPAAIWVHSTYIAGSLLGPAAMKSLQHNALFGQAYWFSVLYSRQNFKRLYSLVVAAARYLLFVKDDSQPFTRLDVWVLLFRTLKCQAIGLQIKKWRNNITAEDP